MIRARKAVAWLAVLALVAGSSSPAFAYLKLGADVDGRLVDVRWTSQPVPYFVTETGVPGVAPDALRAAAASAAATWQAVPSASVRFAFQGMTDAAPEGMDGRTTIGFADHPELDRVLGATSFILDERTGAIVEADVFLNSRFAWSTAPQGEAGKVDVESVVLHELGHLLGLGHSAIGETERSAGGARRVTGSGAIMFPIAMSAGAVADRVLQSDDIAGISDLYPASAPAATSSISGRVLKGGVGLFGAHVVAFNLASGALVGNFALDDAGTFVIGQLPPGVYILRVEPLDDAEVDAFFARPIDADFGVTYASRVVVAPAGGSSLSIDVTVRAK